MCGVAGILSTEPACRSEVERMLEALIHRGPDDVGFFRDGPFHGGMRRLSINDVEGGMQPLFNQDRSIAVLYNGEIYNSPRLRSKLETQGVQFRTRSDGEVISHLYERVGERVFEHLDGMFAVALWDIKAQKLLLARDISGEKPLFYSELGDGKLAFSSEAQSLIKCSRVSRELNRQALWDFPTFLWTPEPQTTFEHVQALERGSYLVADLKSTRIAQYPYQADVGLEIDPNVDPVTMTRDVVTYAVKSRLLSDVPIGAFLSGGLDSAIVTALTTQELGPIDTFCIAFEDIDDPYHGRANEADAAQETADFLGTNHHTINVTASDFGELIEDFCKFSDQPFGVSSGLGVLKVADFASEMGIKVLLTGDGADEMFGGYSWYPLLPHIADASLGMSQSQDVSFQSRGKKNEELVQNLQQLDQPTRAWAMHYYASEADKRAIYHPDFTAGPSDSRRHFGKEGRWEPVDYLGHDRDYYFPFEMLRKADRFTMARSVEGRVPFAAPLVRRLVETFSWADLVPEKRLKTCLRDAFRDILPMGVIERPKHGFNVPVDHWLSTDGVDG